MPNSKSASSAQIKSSLSLLAIFLIVFLCLSLVLDPVFAAESKNNPSPAPKKQVRQVKKQENFFDKLASFIKTPFNLPALAQNNQRKATPTPTPAPRLKQTQQGPNFLQRIWVVLTAPFEALFTPAARPSPRPTPKPTAQPSPAASPQPSPISEETSTGLAVTSPSTATTATSLVKALSAGTTYVDLIGKTIIDSSGNIYPSNSGLAQTTKPSLGLSTNKFYGLLLNNLEVNTSGDLKTNSKVTLGDEAADTIKLVGRIGSDIIPTGNDEMILGESGRAFKSAAITTITNTTLTTTTFNVGTSKLDDGSATSPALTFSSDTDTGLWRIGANQIALTTAGGAHSGLSINSSGNLGIGNTNASAALQVNNNSSTPFVVQLGGNVGIGFSSPIALAHLLQTSAADAFRIDDVANDVS
ncbi:MAG: hypothetical protein FD167_3441, partial [bacterium]